TRFLFMRRFRLVKGAFQKREASLLRKPEMAEPTISRIGLIKDHHSPHAPGSVSVYKNGLRLTPGLWGPHDNLHIDCIPIGGKRSGFPRQSGQPHGVCDITWPLIGLLLKNVHRDWRAILPFLYPSVLGTVADGNMLKSRQIPRLKH